MSRKLIMKRKREDQSNILVNEDLPEQNTAEKRHRTELESAESPASNSSASTNSILYEALQKIMELQAELDAFEHDLDERDFLDSENEEEARLDAEVAANFGAANQRSNAEALGFAMCAREALLFLQSEGVATDSELYKSLLGKLVGQSNAVLES